MSDAKIVVGADASAVKTAAQMAINAWKGVSNSISEGFTTAARSIASDLSQVALSAGHVSFASQHQQVREFEGATARFAVAAGRDLESVRSQIESTGLAISKRPGEVAAWENAVGRLTYSYDTAGQAIRGMAQLAAETGRSVEDYAGLAAELQNVGKVGGDTTHVVGVLASQAEKLGTTGGVAAFADQIEGLGDVISHFAVSSEKDFTKVTALAGELGKGLSPQAAQRVQSSALGSLASNPMEWSRYLQRDITDENGQIKDPASVMREITEKIKRTYGKDARRMLQYQFGAETGAALFRADFDRASELAGASPSDEPSKALAALNATDAQRRVENQAQLDKTSRDMMGSQTLLGAGADAAQGFSASHPILGTLGSSMAGTTMAMLMTKLTGRIPAMIGGSGEVLSSFLGFGSGGGNKMGEEAAGGGGPSLGGEGSPVFVTNWPSGLGGMGGGGAGGAMGAAATALEGGSAGALLTGGAVAAPVAAAAATALAQLGVVASLGKDRDKMGAEYRADHANLLAKEEKLKADRDAKPVDEMRERELAFSRTLQQAGLSPEEALAQVKAASASGTLPPVDVHIELTTAQDTPLTVTTKNSRSHKAGSQRK